MEGPIARWYADRRGVLDRPGGYKAQESPVPYLGGTAVVVAFAAVVFGAVVVVAAVFTVVARPDLFLREEWAVAMGGDPVQSTINRAFLRGPTYVLQKTIMVKGAPVIEIYRRDSQHGIASESK